MRDQFDDFTESEQEVLEAAKRNVWTDKEYEQFMDADFMAEQFVDGEPVCICGHCDSCREAIGRVFQAETIEPVEALEPMPRDCRMPKSASNQIFELRRMWRGLSWARQ